MAFRHSVLLYPLHILYKVQLSKQRQEFGISLCCIFVVTFHFLDLTKRARNLISIQLMIATGNFYCSTHLCENSLTYIKFWLSVILIHKDNTPSNCPVSRWPWYAVKFQLQFSAFPSDTGKSYWSSGVLSLTSTSLGPNSDLLSPFLGEVSNSSWLHYLFLLEH